MIFPQKPRSDESARTDASEALDTARDEQQRLGQENEDAKGTADELSAGVKLGAADDRVAAREAWVKYAEHRY